MLKVGEVCVTVLHCAPDVTKIHSIPANHLLLRSSLEENSEQLTLLRDMNLAPVKQDSTESEHVANFLLYLQLTVSVMTCCGSPWRVE